MTSSVRFRRFAFTFGIAFAVLYVIVLARDLPLFTVYPSIGVVLPGVHHSADTVAPSMGRFLPVIYWYGWTATAALGALLLGIIAALLPERWMRSIWPVLVWVAPAGAMAACVYLALPWFRL